MKLVRDHIPALHEAQPTERRPRRTFRRADDVEQSLLLRLKLAEELGEVLSAPARDQMLDELYDLRDVIDALIVHEFSREDEADADVRHENKVTRLGGFGWGWVLTDD